MNLYLQSTVSAIGSAGPMLESARVRSSRAQVMTARGLFVTTSISMLSSITAGVSPVKLTSSGTTVYKECNDDYTCTMAIFMRKVKYQLLR